MIGTRQQFGAAGAYRAIEGAGAKPEDFMKMAIAVGDRVEKAQALSSANSVVEFMLGLSGSAPGALSQCLASVYQYVLAAIFKGNAGDDTEAVSAARIALEELAATWRTIFPDTIGREESGSDSALTGRRDYA
jgi:flagellin-specific chaperone FliS